MNDLNKLVATGYFILGKASTCLEYDQCQSLMRRYQRKLEQAGETIRIVDALHAEIEGVKWFVALASTNPELMNLGRAESLIDRCRSPGYPFVSTEDVETKRIGTDYVRLRHKKTGFVVSGGKLGWIGEDPRNWLFILMSMRLAHPEWSMPCDVPPETIPVQEEEPQKPQNLIQLLRLTIDGDDVPGISREEMITLHKLARLWDSQGRPERLWGRLWMRS